jgi:hypothetical protein
VPQSTSHLVIYLLRTCLDGIEFELMFTPRHPPPQLPARPNTPMEQPITLASPVPLRADGNEWKEEIRRLGPGNAIEWKHTEPDTPKLRPPGADGLVRREALVLYAQGGIVWSPGVQRWGPLGCPSAPYGQPQPGPVEFSHYGRFVVPFRQRLQRADEVAISFEDFRAGRASADHIVFLEDRLLGDEYSFQEVSQPELIEVPMEDRSWSGSGQSELYPPATE